jgi:hypothetical protein
MEALAASLVLAQLVLELLVGRHDGRVPNTGAF